MEISELIGKTLTSVNVTDDEVHFICSDGKKYKLYHEQDCCEYVGVEEVIGDLKDLLDYPILKASEDTSKENPEGITKNYQDSFTWTFYNIATIKGYITIRFYGESNGYYSESVSFDSKN